MIDAPALEASNIGADGMLGIDSLRSQRVLFDFKAQDHVDHAVEQAAGTAGRRTRSSFAPGRATAG